MATTIATATKTTIRTQRGERLRFRAQRYGQGGQVSITDIDRRNSNSYRVRGVIDAGYNNYGSNGRYDPRYRTRYDPRYRTTRYDPRYDTRYDTRYDPR